MKIGILTSGGDAPGMNAAIRAVVRYALYFNHTVVGYIRGYQGILDNEYVIMNSRSVSDILQRGGTILKTARCDEFRTVEGRAKAGKILRESGIEGLIVVGGNGSFAGAELLYKEQNILTIGIPATIDNDLAYTDYCIGFDTAANTVVSAINNIKDTMLSLERASIVEVMGRHCGAIALYAGIACGAEAILIPEKKFDIDKLCKNIESNSKKGKKSDIIVLAEGVMHANELEALLRSKIEGFAVRSTVLGYIQRGGSPTLNDRVLATRMGVKAVDLLLKGMGGQVIAVKGNKLLYLGISEAIAQEQGMDEELYNIAQVLCK